MAAIIFVMIIFGALFWAGSVLSSIIGRGVHEVRRLIQFRYVLTVIVGFFLYWMSPETMQDLLEVLMQVITRMLELFLRLLDILFNRMEEVAWS